MCHRGEYLLWLGCGARLEKDDFKNYDPEHPPRGDKMTWCVFAEVEIPPFGFKSMFRKWLGQLDLDSPLRKLDSELENILVSEQNITLALPDYAPDTMIEVFDLRESI